MSMSVRDRIVAILNQSNVKFEEYHHQPCASSEESARTRQDAGAGDTVGAKALLVRNKKSNLYSVCVIPGHMRLNSKALRKVIGKNTFASSAEMESVTGGLKPGHMPPFGSLVFSEVTNLIVDSNMPTYNKIGFNAGDPRISIVLSGEDYFGVCEDNCILQSIC